MRLNFFFIIFLLSSASFPAFAQPARTLHIPLSGTGVLREVGDTFSAQVIHTEMEEPDGDGEAEALRVAKQLSAAAFPRRTAGAVANKGTAAQQPVVVNAFVPDSMTGIPPDNYMAVNKQGQGVNVMNSAIAVLDAATGAQLLRKTLYQFSLPVGLNNTLTQTNNYRYDPKVIYDPEADRFIAVMLNGINQYSYIVVGFSQTNDATGAWNWYKFYGDYAGDTTWFDYPTIGLTKSDFFVCGNKLGYNTSFQNGFHRSVIYQMRKADGYAGNTLTTNLWDTVNYGGAPIRNLFPAKGGAGLKGPAQYFVNVRNVDVQNDTVFLIKISDTAGSAAAALTVTPLVANTTYGVPPNGLQKGTVKKLATNDGRVLGAFEEGTEIQFVATSVIPATGASGIYHGIISNYATASVVQAARITVDTLDFGYPNLSYAGLNAGKNTSILTFNYTGANAFPGLGGVFWDGTAHSTLLQAKTGDGYISVISADSVQRWGDYSGSQPEWTSFGQTWAVGLYGRASHSYGNWMVKLRSPLTTAVGTPPGLTAHATAFPNPALKFIRIAFELERDAFLHFTITDVKGRLVAPLLDARAERGDNLLEFNTSALAPGTYFITGSAGGKPVFTKTFLRR